MTELKKDLNVEFPENSDLENYLLETAMTSWNIPIQALKYASFKSICLKDALIKAFNNKEIVIKEGHIFFKNEKMHGIGHFFNLFFNEY